MKSCFSLVKHMNTEEVMPAKHVIDAALTFKGKAERGILLGNQKKKIINIWKTQAQNCLYVYWENFYDFQSMARHRKYSVHPKALYNFP